MSNAAPKESNKYWYAVKHADKEVRAKSRSGGVFTALTDYVLNRGGRIYGVKTADDFTAIHTFADTKTERDAFRGSKYVQSDMGKIIRQVENDLKEEKLVLFSGTPCQTAAVYKYVSLKLKEVPENLILVDIVCHGVPSPRVWKDYVSWVENKKHKKVASVDFRNKEVFGWRDHVESLYFEDGSVFHSTFFRYLFYRHLIIRSSCFRCPYRKEHLSDITIADCWGIEKADKCFDDNAGISLVIPNSVKGEKLFDVVSEHLRKIEVLPNDVMQMALSENYGVPDEREIFWRDYRKMPLSKILRKYATDSLKVKTKRFIKRILGKGGIYDEYNVNR